MKCVMSNKHNCNFCINWTGNFNGLLCKLNLDWCDYKFSFKNLIKYVFRIKQ
jgi:hypothetical protein